MEPEVRLLRRTEWELLKPIFDEQGGNMPNASAIAAVAMDEKGLAGFWTLQMMWHAGPLWIRPDLRGKGLWRRLHTCIHRLFIQHAGTGYYSFSGEPRMEHVFTELGYTKLPYTLWKREV